ncbi:MAG TPA: hypothetical protein PK389_05480, partial [Gammaproteobacteria bacterium]|nr:hypothetical protein [Gammaproteobacteria bacterium]
ARAQARRRAVGNRQLPQQTTMPAIVFTRTNTMRDDIAHSGAMGLAQAIIQVSIFSETSLDARNLSDAIRKLFHVYKGTVNTVQILLSKVMNEIDLYDSETEIYHTVLDLDIKYREPTS